MSHLLSENLLTWLATVLLGASAALALWALVREDPEQSPGERGRPARWCAAAGGYLLLLALTVRGLQAHGFPLTSTYEATLLTVASTAVVYAVAVPGRLAPLGALCAGLVCVPMAVIAPLVIPPTARTPQPPPPALTGIWFPLHVVVTAVGYGGLLLAGSAALLRLARGRRGENSSLSADLEALSWRGLAVGYVGLSAGMLLGAVWGWRTWGYYWSWTVKEVLALLTWGLFTLAFHTRRLKGWRGRPHAAILVTGLVALLVTLLAAGPLARLVSPTTLYIF